MGQALIRDDRGATAIEYGMIIALIIIAMISALNGVAGTTINMWGNVSRTVVRSG